MNKTQFINLAAASENTSVVQCDICIVGAGAAGIYLSTRLAAKNLNVVLLEAGGQNCTDATTVFGAGAAYDADPYPGATLGRYFGLGGTTSNWGGTLVPHTKYDLRNPVKGFDAWSHIVQVVSEKGQTVLHILGWHKGDDFFDSARMHLGDRGKVLQSAGLQVACSLILPFRKKNFHYLLKKKRSDSGRIRVFYNAVVNKFETNKSASTARLQKIGAMSDNKNQLFVKASRFILAAGAIESARLLLELDQSSPQALLKKGAQTGRFLADHLSIAIADVAMDDNKMVIRNFAPHFKGGWMRNFRFTETVPPTDSPRSFCHFVFENANPGFALAKEVFGAVQQRRLPVISIKETIAGIGGVTKIGYNRYVRSSLFIPADTTIKLQLDIEQDPLKKNGVKLGDKLDRFGRRIATIHWRISDEDQTNILKTADRVLKKWTTDNQSLPRFLPLNRAGNATKPHDAYHPVGTLRLGQDREAVVDKNLKVWGLNNLWAVSTGVLPSAGSANPTFTMLCLADKLVDELLLNKEDQIGD